MKRCYLPLLLALALLLPSMAKAAEGTVPKAARAIAAQLDQQLAQRIGTHPGGKRSVSIAITVPVFLSNLGQSSPLARQMAEEITCFLVEAGYSVEEIRKGRDIVMEEGVGEMILTRNLNRLASRDVNSAAILAGTFTVTSESVRFNVKLLHTPTNEVLAMGTATVPVTTETFPLVADRRGPMLPSVGTRLN